MLTRIEWNGTCQNDSSLSSPYPGRKGFFSDNFLWGHGWSPWVKHHKIVGEDLLEKEIATHCSILAWKISRTEEPVSLQSMESPGVRHNLATKPPPSPPRLGVSGVFNSHIYPYWASINLLITVQIFLYPGTCSYNDSQCWVSDSVNLLLVFRSTFQTLGQQLSKFLINPIKVV